MATEITNSLVSTVLKNRPAEPIRLAASPVDTVSKRQDVAVNNTVLPGSAEEQPATKAQLEQAVSDINAYVQTVNREIQFRVDEALPLGRSIVTVIDSDTEETIREFPSKEALALAHRLREETAESTQAQIEGLIISARA